MAARRFAPAFSSFGFGGANAHLVIEGLMNVPFPERMAMRRR